MNCSQGAWFEFCSSRAESGPDAWSRSMTTLAVPIVKPETVHYFLDDPTTLTQQICILNPFSFHVLFKADLASPVCNIALKQGVINSRQKLFLEITCTSQVPAEDGVQVRFFKYSRPSSSHRHHQHAQKYLGFRTVNIRIWPSRAEREERTPETDQGSVSASSWAGQGLERATLTSAASSVSQGPSSDKLSQHSDSERSHGAQVKTHLILCVCLLLCGILLAQTDAVWFEKNIVEGLSPQTLSIVFYTLSGVLFVQVVTYRR